MWCGEGYDDGDAGDGEVGDFPFRGEDADDAPVLTLASVDDDDDVFLFFKRM